MSTKELSSLPTTDLLEQALGEAKKRQCVDHDLYRTYVAQLHRRPSREVFEQASRWCAGVDPVERSLGADILGQLGHIGPNRSSPFGESSLPILLGLLEDADSWVLQSTIHGLGHLASWGVEWDSELLRELTSHSDDGVRLSVAFALGGAQCDRSSSAVEILLDLMRDEDVDVRSWATFGVGVMSDADSPQIRAALHSRLAEPNQEVRGEAMVGLAKRGDEAVIPSVLEDLSLDEVPSLAIEAASELGLPEFLPDLEDLLDGNPDDAQILEAIERCSRSGETS